MDNLDIVNNVRRNITKLYLLVLVGILLFACTENSERGSEKLSNESMQEMVKELRSIALDTSNIEVWHLNKLRAQATDRIIAQTNDAGQFISLSFKSGIEWLNAGDYSAAINRLEAIFALIKKHNISIPDDAYYTIKEVLGMCYLRKAEIENCVQHHNEYSCLIPIHPDGQHVLKEGSQKALEIFRDLLNTKNPKWQTKWLYNIAHMTLGGYPAEVEAPFLIDESIFSSELSFPRFRDIGMSLGLGINDISGSVVMEDFNNDNYLDLMISSYGLDDQLQYYENDKNGGFKNLTEAAGLNGLWSGLNMVQADYNNDGWTDLFILRGAWLGKDGNHPNSLLKNNGDGTFSDVTKESGLYCHFPTQTASWADFNNDGWIDLFIGNEHSQNVNAPSQLFQNNGDGTFRDVANEKGAAVRGFIKGCVWGDFNNDTYPDLYLSFINQGNQLLQNGGPQNGFNFMDVAASAKTTEPEKSFPCWFFDFNQDGWEDIFVSGFDFSQFESAGGEVAKGYLGLPTNAELPRLYRNDGNGTFTEVSSEMQVDKVLYTMGCNYGDLDNDGFPDFYAGTGTPDFRALIPNRMFLNLEGKRFTDVTTSGGFGHLQKGHGIAFGDMDNDGDQDVYTVLGGSYDGDNFMNAFYLNPGSKNYWLKLKLIGSDCNRSAIGAKVQITVSNAQGESRTFYNKVSSGASFGANPLLIEQGLGNYSKVDRIDIFWPGQEQPQIIQNVQSRSFVRITQGNPNTEIVNAKNVKFKEQKHHHH